MSEHDAFDLNRRELLQLLGMASLTLAAPGGVTMAAPSDDRPLAYRGEHQVKPLPFDPSKLTGLSERLLRSHHENNYAGAVKRLNLIEQQIGGLPSDAPPYQIGSLKREELIATNSMLLHEAYFANLSGTGGADGTFAALAKHAYGSVERWEQDFRATALSLAGGSGWVVASWDAATRTLHNWWAFDHTHGITGGTPVLVLDMYEHGYHMDFGANAKAYVDAVFRNVRWDEVNARLERLKAS